MFHHTFLITRQVEILKAATAKMFFQDLVQNFQNKINFRNTSSIWVRFQIDFWMTAVWRWSGNLGPTLRFHSWMKPFGGSDSYSVALIYTKNFGSAFFTEAFCNVKTPAQFKLLFSVRTLPSSQKPPAPAFPCKLIVEWRTSGGGSTWRWNCLGVRTEPFSSSVRSPSGLFYYFMWCVWNKNKYLTFLPIALITGRTHRSNQVTAPEYVFLISELAGEQRFASIVAKRLESLVKSHYMWIFFHWRVCI